MKRRGFLGVLAASPLAGKAAADQVLSDLSLGEGTSTALGAMPTTASDDMEDYHKDSLARLLGQSAARLAYSKRCHGIRMLDPGVGSLRSVALHKKISMSKEIDWERSQREEKAYHRGGIAGWFSD